jgi:hypothetical protein
MKNKINKPKKNKDLNSLSKSELIDLLIEEHNKKTYHNKIEVADFSVESTGESLKVCHRTMNKLIGEHKDFVTLRRIKSQVDGNLLSGGSYG